MEKVEVVLFPLIGVYMLFAVAIWFYQLTKFYGYLKLNHPEIYKAMGEPTIFPIKTQQNDNDISFLKFLIGRQYKKIEDIHLEKWCIFLTRFLYVYIIVFAGLCIYLVGFRANPS